MPRFTTISDEELRGLMAPRKQVGELIAMCNREGARQATWRPENRAPAPVAEGAMRRRSHDDQDVVSKLRESCVSDALQDDDSAPAIGEIKNEIIA